MTRGEMLEFLETHSALDVVIIKYQRLLECKKDIPQLCMDTCALCEKYAVWMGISFKCNDCLLRVYSTRCSQHGSPYYFISRSGFAGEITDLAAFTTAVNDFLTLLYLIRESEKE